MDQTPRRWVSHFAAMRWAATWTPAFQSHRALFETFCAVANYTRNDHREYANSQFGPIAVSAASICKGVMRRQPVQSSEATVRDHLVALTLAGLITPGRQEYALLVVSGVGTGVRVTELNDQRIAPTSATVQSMRGLITAVAAASNRRFARPRPPKDLVGADLDQWREDARRAQLDKQASVQQRAIDAICRMPAELYGGPERRDALIAWAFADRDARQNMGESLWPGADCQFSTHWRAEDRREVVAAMATGQQVPAEWAPLPISWEPVMATPDGLKSYRRPRQVDMATNGETADDASFLWDAVAAADAPDEPAVTESVDDFDADVSGSDELVESPGRRRGKSPLPDMTPPQQETYSETARQWLNAHADLQLGKAEQIKFRVVVATAVVRGVAPEDIQAVCDQYLAETNNPIPSPGAFGVAMSQWRRQRGEAGTPSGMAKALGKTAGMRPGNDLDEAARRAAAEEEAARLKKSRATLDAWTRQQGAES